MYGRLSEYLHATSSAGRTIKVVMQADRFDSAVDVPSRCDREAKTFFTGPLHQLYILQLQTFPLPLLYPNSLFFDSRQIDSKRR
jgi:hypothetical protein